MHRPFTALALLCAFAAPASAFADMTCRYTAPNGDLYVGSFHPAGDGLVSKLELNGKAVPALHACITWAHGNSHMGGDFRCPHGEGELRLEVYPVFGDNDTGKAAEMRVIRWNGDTLQETVETQDCR